MKKLFVIGFLFASILGFGQSLLDTVRLGEVVAVAQKPGFNEVGKKQQKLDSTLLVQYQGKTLGDILAGETGFSFKQYGISGSTGAAMRGTSSDHTAVMWNGINMQSPTHGQFDFTLFPVFFTDKITVEPGAGTGSYGSGAVGGAVLLNNQTPTKNGFSGKAFLSRASFNKNQLGLGVAYKGNKVYTQLRVYNQHAQNRYTYRKFYLPELNNYYLLKQPDTVKRAEFNQQGFMHQTGIVLGSQLKLDNVLLYTKTNRMLMNSTGVQLDDNCRNTTTLSFKTSLVDLSALVGIQYESLLYTDSVSKIRSLSKTRSGWLQVGGKIYLKENSTFYAFVNPLIIQAQVDGYGGQKPRQNRVSMWGGWQKNWLNDQLITDVSVRNQFINGKNQPIVPSAGIQFKPLATISFKAHSAAVYHAPDFNDLYWAPGGNPNLLPEKGWSNEVGAAIKHQNFSAELTGFSNRTKNLIVWQPGAVFWSPVNIREVVSRGVEASLSQKLIYRQLKISAELHYSYTHSIVTKTSAGNEGELNKFLPYIPVHNGLLRLAASYKSWQLHVNAHHFSKRYINAANQNWLPAYQLLSIYAAKSLAIGQIQFQFFAAVNNALDYFYMAQQGYPMPGRNYEIGINLNIK